MSKYMGVVREIYEYEIEVDAEDAAEAAIKLKEFYNDDDKNAGVFLADANSFLLAKFALRNRK